MIFLKFSPSRERYFYGLITYYLRTWEKLINIKVNQSTLLITVHLLHVVSFFYVASLFSTGVDNKKVGVENEKALELTNATVFHRWG